MNGIPLERQLVSEFEGQIESELAVDEGQRATYYLDSRGIKTIGFGHNVEASPLPYGMVPPLSYAQQIALLRDDIAIAEAALKKHLLWVASVAQDARLGVLVDLTFNMGVGKLVAFTHMLTAYQSGQWETCANELMNSAYAKQVPARCKRLASQLMTNRWAVETDIA